MNQRIKISSFEGKRGRLLIVGEFDRENVVVSVGGKTASVIRLVEEGFRIPEGFGLSVQVFQAVLDANGLSNEFRETMRSCSRQKSEVLKERLKNSGIPLWISDVFRDAASKVSLIGEKLVVRSSATVEDGSNDSFAGQFDTVVGVDILNLDSAIKSVYSSLLNKKALAYSWNRGVDISCMKMGILIQKLVDTDVGGVMFTANPLNGNRDEVWITYKIGLAEGVVSGTTSSDTLKLRKTDICETKETVTMKGNPQTMVVLVPELLRLAITLDGIYGKPLDIEWGVKDNSIYLFQVRYMTNILR